MTTLRPSAARWFELVTDREHLGGVLRCLAETRRVELQAHSVASTSQALPDYGALLATYHELAQRYAPYWPEPRVDAAAAKSRSIDRVHEDLDRLTAWAHEADAPIARLQVLAGERAALAELAALVGKTGSPMPDLALLSACGPALVARLYALEGPAAPLALPAGVLSLPLEAEGRRYLLAVAAAADLPTLDRQLSAAKARAVALPTALPTGSAAVLTELESRLKRLDADITAGRRTLDALAKRHGLAALLAEFAFLDWLVRNVPELPATENFAWVTGWTSDLDGQVIEAALNREDLPHLVHFPEAPRSLDAPVVLRNPPWAQPFEAFVKLLGVPSSTEADPSPLLAVIAPLLFGFMFGDVGQGAVLLVAGLALRKRMPALALLIPGGISAIFFGVLFGSVFAMEDVIPPLWLHPITAPATVLGASVVIGMAVIALGLVLDGFEHMWRGAGRSWIVARAGLALMYAGMLVTPFRDYGLLMMLAGIAWFVIGELALGHGAAAAAGRAAGELVETLLQLVVNTVSFARVGAFALAHAGLSSAVVGIAEATGSTIGFWVSIALGNVLILALEGMVVGIQTTRLVLFEFFIRFLRGEGRAFRPLPPPSATLPHS